MSHLKLKRLQSEKMDETKVEIWKEHLRQRCILSNFYEEYDVIKQLSKGTFAKVFLALKDKKEYAVKCFKKDYIKQCNFGSEGLKQEILSLRIFSHQNLLKLYEIYEDDHNIYLITELLDGGELLEKFKTCSYMNQNDLQMIMFKLLQTINHIHLNGYMHRDIKPENIMFRSKNTFDVVLIDFGLMTKVSTKTYHFIKCGSPGFVAPEILNYDPMIDTIYDQQCDIFSLGIVFYIIATGIHPFKGKDYQEIIRKNIYCNIDFTLDQFEYFPKEFKQLLQQMLQYKPDKRITSENALKHPYFDQISAYATPLDSFRNISNYQSDFLDFIKLQNSEHDLCNNIILVMDQDLNEIDSPKLGQKMKQLSI